MQKLSLQQKLLQKLSPQQIQVIKLLELPGLLLEQRIKKELEENPVLEIESEDYGSPDEDNSNDLKSNEDHDNEEFSVSDYLNEEDEPGYRYNTQNTSKDDKATDIPFSDGTSFHEYLQDQMNMEMLNERDVILAEHIIGNIDEDGYLRRDIASIVDDLEFTQNVKTSELELIKILRIIQNLEPPGVGARNLRECLRLQLYRKGDHKPEIKLAGQILRDAFDELHVSISIKLQGNLVLMKRHLKVQ